MPASPWTLGKNKRETTTKYIIEVTEALHVHCNGMNEKLQKHCKRIVNGINEMLHKHCKHIANGMNKKLQKYCTCIANAMNEKLQKQCTCIASAMKEKLIIAIVQQP